MKRRVKVDVVTEDLSGPRRVVERGTITLNGRQYRKIKGDQWKREQANKEFTEQQRLAALYLTWEEEMAEILEK